MIRVAFLTGWSREGDPISSITMIKRFLPLLILASVSPVPALAGSITIESIRDEAHARLLATNRVPAGAEVSRTKCRTVQVKGDDRYRCTVYYAPE